MGSTRLPDRCSPGKLTLKSTSPPSVEMGSRPVNHVHADAGRRDSSVRMSKWLCRRSHWVRMGQSVRGSSMGSTRLPDRFAPEKSTLEKGCPLGPPGGGPGGKQKKKNSRRPAVEISASGRDPELANPQNVVYLRARIPGSRIGKCLCVSPSRDSSKPKTKQNRTKQNEETEQNQTKQIKRSPPAGESLARGKICSGFRTLVLYHEGEIYNEVLPRVRSVPH